MIYYVDGSAFKSGDGSADHPFRTIQMAADLAQPGDEVLVAPGVYRENVNPKHAGTPEQRIVYRSNKPLGAVITGAEPAKNWMLVNGTVWKLTVPNTAFNDYNPYTTLVKGDWYNPMAAVHTGEVYLNGKSLYEVMAYDDVFSDEKYLSSWDPDFTVYKWFTQQKEDMTEIFANFRGLNPNEENVEINVRRNCFYPQVTGIGYITVDGFVLKQAATNWAPPTAYQEGLIGPHWSKGWIITDCEISHSKCSGVSLGKYLQPFNDNKWTTGYYKDGTQTERENICLAQAEGWTKERIGSHIVRRCNIHDCGQTGIVGHLGGVFSLIEDNHIHHINNKQNLAGAEIGGIKMHAAIDVIIRRNEFDHCTRGLWLDWQAQGTRVSQNLFHDNMPPRETKIADGLAMAEDLFIEVSHGPTLVDNNIFLSEVCCRLSTQGTAFVHNLIAGSFSWVGTGTDNNARTLPSPRYTPYHMRHRTEVAGFMTILHGDDRFYNNIFVQQELVPEYLANARSLDREKEFNFECGTAVFNGYPTAKEYFAQFNEISVRGKAPGGKDLYYRHLPVYASGNLYFNGAKPWDQENDAYVDEKNTVQLKLNTDGGIKLETNLFELLPDQKVAQITTATLGMAFEPEQLFENPDGTAIVFDRDFFGEKREMACIAGPFACKCEAGKKLF